MPDIVGTRSLQPFDGNACMNEPLQPVKSVGELCERMMRERRYGGLAMIVAKRMGGDADSLLETKAWLLELAAQDGEQAVLDEINRCLSLV
jgi:hypothetical protein